LHASPLTHCQLPLPPPAFQVRTSGKTAVLFGDFVFVKALSGIGRILHPDAAGTIYRAVGHMLEGEIRESGAELIGEPEYLDIIGRKTGALFAAAGELGVMLSGGDTGMREWGREMGEAAGMTYQIIDDLLDLAGDSAKTGKPIRMDLNGGCLTLPLIHALRGADPETVGSLLRGEIGPPERIVAFIREHGGLTYTFAKADEYRRKAGEAARRFGHPEAAAALDDFLNSLTAGVDPSCLT
jgi:geranylgeranyl pyrophosphate synthase